MVLRRGVLQVGLRWGVVAERLVLQQVVKLLRLLLSQLPYSKSRRRLAQSQLVV